MESWRRWETGCRVMQDAGWNWPKPQRHQHRVTASTETISIWVSIHRARWSVGLFVVTPYLSCCGHRRWKMRRQHSLKPCPHCRRKVRLSKTKIQQVGEPRLSQSTVQVAAENVDLVDEFIYLGSLISHDGGSEAEILRRKYGNVLPPRRRRRSRRKRRLSPKSHFSATVWTGLYGEQRAWVSEYLLSSTTLVTSGR